MADTDYQSLEGVNGIASDITPWDYAKRYLPFGEHATEEEVHGRLLSGTAHLWNGPGCSAVTEVGDNGNLHIWLAGGDFGALLDMLPAAELFARAMGCPALELGGRSGWHRAMVKYGFETVDDETMIKVLD